MPLVYACRSCGIEIFRLDHSSMEKHALPPRGIIEKYLNCPQCGRKLRPPDFAKDLKITPLPQYIKRKLAAN